MELSNNTGQLEDPNLHDGILIGIITKKDRSVVLSVEDDNHGLHAILLQNVGWMNVMHFWGGDSILDVSLVPIRNVAEHALRMLFHDRISDDKQIADAVARDGRKYLFILECSYGADVYITCDQMQIDAH